MQVLKNLTRENITCKREAMDTQASTARSLTESFERLTKIIKQSSDRLFKQKQFTFYIYYYLIFLHLHFYHFLQLILVDCRLT